MTVLSVEKEKKHLFRVTFSEGETVLLDREVCALAGLKAGCELSESDLKALREQSDYTRAKERALWYLDQMDYTERKLREKLCRASFPPEICDRVLANLKEYGVVDDERFAARAVERCAAQNISARQTLQKLYQKGVPAAVAKSAVADGTFDEEAQVRAWIEKKYAQKLDTPENTQKVFAALCRKGFSFGAVRAALKQYCAELEYCEE